MTLFDSKSPGDLPSSSSVSSSSTSASQPQQEHQQQQQRERQQQYQRQHLSQNQNFNSCSSCDSSSNNPVATARSDSDFCGSDPVNPVGDPSSGSSSSCSSGGGGSGISGSGSGTQDNNGTTTLESLVGENLPVVMDNRNSGGGRIMTSWAQRMHRRAATLGTVVTSCGHPSAPYPRRIEKVKFGVPLDEVCKNDIPGPLLVLILKLNKEAPYKKDVFRAPGHQGNMKKLIHFLQNGRLVNIDNFSVYTIASVLKKFLRKLPDGIFGREGEQQLFQIIDMTSTEQQRDHIHALISSLPVCTQRLIVLLFGTFRVIASNSERSQTGMTSEALGVSVAPSFFQSCVSDGKQAKMEDVMRFKVATKIMKFLIDNFGVSNLFGRENYEYYARITGRILKVEEDWIFSFRYPPDALVSRQQSLEAEKTWLQYESERWGLNFNLAAMSHQEESHSTPALIQASDRLDADNGDPSSSLSSIPENNLLESYTRLSISLEDNGLFKVTEVSERQAARMKTRSEWFLSPSTCPKMPPVDVDDMSNSYLIFRDEAGAGNCYSGGVLSSSNESVKHPPIRRTSSKEKERRLVRRSSSKKNKENGASGGGGGGTTASGGSACSASAACSGKKYSSTSTASPLHQQSMSCTGGDINNQMATSSSSSATSPPPGGELAEGAASLVSIAAGDKKPVTPSRRSTSSNLYDNIDCTLATPPPDALTGEGGSCIVAAATTTSAGGSGGGIASVVPTNITNPSSNISVPLDANGGGSEAVVGAGVGGGGGSASSERAIALVSELDCTETDVQTFHVTLTYKPRI